MYRPNLYRILPVNMPFVSGNEPRPRCPDNMSALKPRWTVLTRLLLPHQNQQEVSKDVLCQSLFLWFNLLFIYFIFCEGRSYMCLHFLSSIILHWCHFVKDATFVQAFCVNFSCAQINTWCLNPGTIEMFAFIFCIYFSSILCNVQTCLKNKTVVSNLCHVP